MHREHRSEATAPSRNGDGSRSGGGVRLESENFTGDGVEHREIKAGTRERKAERLEGQRMRLHVWRLGRNHFVYKARVEQARGNRLPKLMCHMPH